MAEQINVEKIEPKVSVASVRPEKPLSPEKIVESAAKVVKVLPQVSKTISNPVASSGLATQTNANSYNQKRAAEIDKILSEGLEDIFIGLAPAEQQKFKISGEETVSRINKILSETKIKVKKIVDLIRRWLATLPGVNRYFLEQEAKIKTDKIMRLNNK